MPAFEYKSHFEPLVYKRETIGSFVFKQEREDFGSPMASTFVARCDEQVLAGFGDEGWELVSTQPVWKVASQFGNQQTDVSGNGQTVVDGYIFFFKRQRM